MELNTSRLRLREFEEDDGPAVHAYGSDREVVRYMLFGPSTEEQSREFIRQAREQALEVPRRFYELAVVLKTEDRLIGGCTLALHADPRQASFSYLLHRQYWGHGYASEAMQALFTYGFRELGLHRISDTVDPANRASVRVLEKLGLRCEGHQRESQWIKGQWRDCLVYAVLDHEWRHLPSK